MKYALKKLKEEGKEVARLRVHMKNARAKKHMIHLGSKPLNNKLILFVG